MLNIFGQPVPAVSGVLRDIAAVTDKYEQGLINKGDLSANLWYYAGLLSTSPSAAVQVHQDFMSLAASQTEYSSYTIEGVRVPQYVVSGVIRMRDRGDQKIPAIKYVRSELSCGLREAKDFVEQVCEW